MSILALGKQQKKERKIPNQRVGESKKKETKFSIKDRKKTEEICKKVFGPDNNWTIQNFHQVNKKKETTTYNGPLPLIADKILCASDFLATH